MANFLRNSWYPAAWDNEVTSTEPLTRQFLGELVVLVRDYDGTVKALHGVCPHRYGPLGRGQVVDGILRCGDDGLGFDSIGACVDDTFGMT